MEFESIKISSRTKERLIKYGLYNDNAERVIARVISHLEAIKRIQYPVRCNTLLLSPITKTLLEISCPRHLTYNEFIQLLVEFWLKQPDKITGYF